MILKYTICILFIKTIASQVLYDAYFGKPLTEDRINTLTLLNATSPCMISVQPCKKHEGRRVDGTCVNPKYPSRNGSPTPFLRMLPAKFGAGNTLRPMMNGSELPSARLIRTKILTEGYHTDHHFSYLLSIFLLGALGDSIDLRYTEASKCAYDYGDTYNLNLISGGVLVSLISYREHNRLARKLSEINPCWDDQKLFETAREIHIARWQFILYYELMSLVLGTKNLLEVGVIYDTDGYVNDFDERFKPGVFHEYALGIRYFHTIQDGRSDLYDNKGKYLGTRTGVDDILRAGIYELNNTEADLTQGSFRQAAAGFDKNMDPDLVERVFGSYQRASDVSAIDINRGRDHGVPPYNAYRRLCGLPVARRWEDFKEIREDRVEQLKRLYGDVDEVELMPAIYSESHMKGAFVGPTLFCIMSRTLLQWRKSDRHFFEHGDLPTSLTLPQLNEIRKSSVARLMCDSGVSVTKIQRQALLNADENNPMVSCEEIPGIDLEKWKDNKCYKEDQTNNDVHAAVNGKYDLSYPEDIWSSYVQKK
ncbi:peroxidase-like [Amyelois transitella]|uniref:peroxidase-like n=1 Tax=Amyelois transitella TaxID=680683 RepID=UPI0029902D1F|nr:peroxidase-like [Amyelois transitella]